MGDLGDEIKRDARSTAGAVVGAGLAAAGSALITWIKSRPVKRALQRRRERRAAARAASK